MHNYPEIHFPEGFIWGSATAAHQIEGDDIHSINWRDQSMYPERFPDHSGKACNSYAMYKEDVVLLQKLGHHAYRFSIPWSRIEPAEGQFCEEAVAHYVDLCRRLKEAGIQIFVTLSHGSDPAWFWDKGGFASREALHYFERYVQFIVPRLAPYADYWLTINEINIMDRPGCNSFDLRKNYMICHAKAYHIIKKHSAKPIGAPHAAASVVPRDPHFAADSAHAAMQDWILNGFFYHALRTGEMVFPGTDAEIVEELKDSFDFWAINYYTRHQVSSRSKTRNNILLTSNRMKLIDREFYMSSFWPEGLYNELQRLKDKPVFLTENGCCCEDDRWRALKLFQDLSAIADAIKDGVDIRGYLHWSLMDNYEWVSFIPRFGLVHVNFKTFERTPKPSAWLFREIIERNGFGPDLVSKYLPELPKFKLFAE
ncbi:MAG: family 1 glycosylhydrolase [Victivallaceae bacterium]|nr:family 1 glycosylhydrolase [Victivallaceae bacterium]